MSLFVDIKKDFGSFYLNASFTMEQKVTGLLGVSGCGKSLTLKCIAGIIKPDSGKIILNGKTLFDSEKRINLKPQYRHVGYLFQNYALFPNMRVRDNILCGLHSVKNLRERENTLMELLSSMQLSEVAELYPHQLSGGQQQRTALARILASKPDLILLDEPFSALDSQLHEKLIFEVKNMLHSYQGMSVLVTHSREEAYDICNEIALMEDGKISAPKETKSLFENPCTIFEAKMMGYKNIALCIKTGEYEIFVPSWGVCLTTCRKVGETIKALAIREWDFKPEEMQNRVSAKLMQPMVQTYGAVVPFRFIGHRIGSEECWWQVAKEKLPESSAITFGISPQKINLLYE